MMRFHFIRIHSSLASFITASSLILMAGCETSVDPAEPVATSYQSQQSADQSVASVQANATLQQLADERAIQENKQSEVSAFNQTFESEVIATPSADTMPLEAELNTAEFTPPKQAYSSPQRTAESSSSRAELNDNLPPEKLIEFLSITDRDMRDIWGRMQQIEGGEKELIRVAKLKLRAAEQLKNHAIATDSQKSLGARGELQALSHLASFNDLEASKKLKAIAELNLSTDDTNLISDSRLVLIGFALEGLKQGDSEAKSKLMDYLLNIPKDNAANDVPTLMVLGQARDTLAAYGEQELADAVRNQIMDLYQDSTNPDIRTAANDLANHVYYDEIETLLTSARNGATVDSPTWEASLNKLITQAGDMRCVQYLASAALQLEGLEQHDAVALTFRILESAFNNPTSQITQEVQVASQAYQARQNIIGTNFELDLPLINQETLNQSDYQGKVVLVPFWTVALPESLQLMKVLEAIRANYPDQVAILGINLDGDLTLLNEFLKQNKLPFQNLHAKSSASNQVLNETATKFGITSMPFLAIINQNNKVAKINFTGQGIEQAVASLLRLNTE